MSSDVSAVPGTAPGTGGAGPRRARDVAVALLRMSKLAVYQHFYPWVLATALLGSAALDRPGAWPALVLFLLATAAVVSAAAAVDDIVGFRNGSDAANYRQSGYRRDIRRKPLLCGAITLRQAVAFAVTAEAAGLVCGAAGFWALGWDVPAWSIVIFFACAVLTPQYSGGLAFSYHRGGSELLLGLGTAGGVVFQYLALERRWALAPVLQGLLLGLWLVMLVSASNVVDADGDAAAGRRTLPAAAGMTVAKTAMVGYVAASLGLAGWLVAAGAAPRWAPAALLPAIVLHGAYLWFGVVQDRWLKARLCAFLAFDAGFAALVAADLVR